MKNILLFLIVLAVVGTTTLWIRYGGGTPYPDLSTSPILDSASLEEVLSYPEPVGNVAVNKNGRLFFTVHPEARPQGNKLLEYVRGAAVPYPSWGEQDELFDTVLGIAIDRFNRLWTIDHGNHGTRTARIIAVDLDTDTVIREQALDPEVAPFGSFLQDLQVSADGNTIVIADASFWRKAPAIVVYDVETGRARRVLEGHESVTAEEYMIHSMGRDMEFLGGVVTLRGGIDGIALGPEWLYFGAISGSGLYRVRLRDLRDDTLPVGQLANRVERVSDKPLSDGFSVDVEGNVYITAIEHSAIFIAGPDKDPQTLIESDRLRWPDALSFGPDGYLYIADSALPELILQSHQDISDSGPYRIFRFRPGVEGVPGQ
ncbi:MAG: L-dopachrome tautomerase-related protein [Woeseiaceae bacterium]|nr:L-dopachrome tautomerase-related protein [Woeseiaceae bacterium]